jgi:hypothetical protein
MRQIKDRLVAFLDSILGLAESDTPSSPVDELRSEENTSPSSQGDYSADAALRDPRSDLFRRWEFAQRVADTIAARSDPNSLVLAVNGQWGEGKSTVLNFIELALKEHETAITYRFNPWRFPSEPELLTGFFYGLADAMGQALPTIRERIGTWVTEYLPAPAAFIGKEAVAKELGKLLSSVRLEELKNRVGEILLEQNHSVVVLMDDIDRLEKHEIQSVFRLVKLTASFENVVYVLAFDDEIVAAALQERYATSSPDAGREFLEKIIQVPLSLPAIDTVALRNLCFVGVDKALDTAGVRLTQREMTRFVQGFVHGVEVRLATPRLAKRYANILMFSLPMVRGEVDYVDFLHVEAIRAFFPESYEVIREHRDLFVGLQFSGHRWPEQAIRERAQATVDLVFEGLSPAERDSLNDLLKTLFPRLNTIFRNTLYGPEWDRTWAEAKRIASSEYVDRYFTFTVPVGDVSDQIVDSYLEGVPAVSEEEAALGFREIVAEEHAAKFIEKLDRRSTALDWETAFKLGVAIAANASRLPFPESLFDFNTPYIRAAILIARLAERIDDMSDEAETFLAHVARSSRPVGFAAQVLRWLRVDEEAQPNWLTQDHKQGLGEEIADRLSEFEKSGEWLFDEHSREGPLLAYVWSKYGDEESLSQHIEAHLEADNEAVFKILLAYTPTAYPLVEGIPTKSDFERSQYEALSSAFRPELLVASLRKRQDVELDSDEYPREGQESVKLRVAKQFLWLHGHVTNGD